MVPHPWLGRHALDRNIPGESFEPATVLLNDGDRDVPRLAGVDVTDRARLAFVGTCDHRAGRAVSQFPGHRYFPGRASRE